MNTHVPGAGATSALPELSEKRIDEIEEAVFADIARERSRDAARQRRRRRAWIASGAAAAVVAVAAVIAPAVGGLVGGTAGSSQDAAVAPVAPADSGQGSSGTESATTDSRGAAPLSLAPDAADGAAGSLPSGRDIITTATATVAVDDVDDATGAVAEAATAHGGYVESMNVGSRGAVQPVTPAEGGVVYDTMPYPVPTDGAWISVRVPADQLSVVMDGLSAIGEVTATNVNRQDVTQQTVDLEARIDAAEASVQRLTELMSQTQSVADLIAAESALSERQALLESYQQQLEALDDQVAMSTLSVTVQPRIETVTADPAGFGDGLAAGWNGLIATLNGIVVAIGFLLPWLAVAAVLAVIVWAIVRLLRRRRTSRRSRPAEAAASDRDTTD
ncbi:DUF4349 domain-containing protein [Microbacterium timonense]|uniref:DUF4349 domain-containing protein n=1 Tax=Microbacterium timonense TaxID=2086576 RepID=UPI000D0EBBBE|nr:DUF4349 domain-containing protein [Microbacterium timonense]